MLHLWKHRIRNLTIEKIFFYLTKTLEKLVLYLLFPASFVFMSTYSLIRGKKYRIVEIDARHLGGWSYALDGFLRKEEKKSAESRFNYLFVMHSKKISNYYFNELMKRHINVIENPFARLILLPLARMKNNFQEKLHGSSYEVITEALQWFSDDDHVRGERLLKELGLDSKHAWYVCFSARDNAYNESTSNKYELDYYNTYHSCRNADIDNCIAAIKFILESGGYVIRMGSVAKKKISYSHPRLIDYPFSGHRSEFADVYLACHCKFFIGTGSGIADVSGISDVPLGMVNLATYSAGMTRKNMLYTPKLIKSAHSGEYVSVKKYFDFFKEPSSLTSEDIFEIMKKNDLLFEDNAEDDILMITKAFYQRFVTKIITDREWALWCEGGDCCRPFHKYYCYIWGPFLEQHSIDVEAI